jgi:hypothetical protein
MVETPSRKNSNAVSMGGLTSMSTSVLRWSVGVIVLANFLYAAPLAIAQQDSAETPATQADAIAIFEVAFVPYGNLVLLTEMLLGSRNDLPDLSELLGPCLPGKAGVRDLAESIRDPANSAVLDAAIDQAGYAAVVFLKRRGGSLSIVCSDPVSLENWLTHPHHNLWRSRLNATLGR